MARGLASNSATSQFYINTADNLFLDYVNPSNPQYCVFGEVVSGMEVVDAIADIPTTQGETPDELVIIESATVIPEPATILLLGLGCLAFVRRRGAGGI
jgi:cyclophilin family peptidyl-prolyl cis-trans isomerase